MKKRVLFLAIVVLIIGSFMGCKEKEVETEQKKSEQMEDTILESDDEESSLKEEIVEVEILFNKTERKTVVCKMDLGDKGVAYEIMLEAEDDIICKLTQTTIIQLSEFPENEVVELEKNLEHYRELYKEYEGTEYHAEVKENILHETIAIDMTNVETVFSLRIAGLLPIDETSLKKVVENLELNGWNIETLGN